jgi:hypothetical protein
MAEDMHTEFQLNRGRALGALVLTLLATPAFIFAHQPRIVENTPVTIIEDPEISKAYYGELTGEPHVFRIDSDREFDFYMNVLVPDVPSAKKDVSAALINPDHPEVPLVIVGGIEAEWKQFFEEFARDSYWQVDEYRTRLEAGAYEIRVWSSNNDSAYSLAVGETESFDFGEILNAYIKIPQIKSFFFEKSAFSALFTPFIGGPFGILLILGGGFFMWRRRLKTVR